MFESDPTRTVITTALRPQRSKRPVVVLRHTSHTGPSARPTASERYHGVSNDSGLRTLTWQGELDAAAAYPSFRRRSRSRSRSRRMSVVAGAFRCRWNCEQPFRAHDRSRHCDPAPPFLECGGASTVRRILQQLAGEERSNLCDVGSGDRGVRRRDRCAVVVSSLTRANPRRCDGGHITTTSERLGTRRRILSRIAPR